MPTNSKSADRPTVNATVPGAASGRQHGDDADSEVEPRRCGTQRRQRSRSPNVTTSSTACAAAAAGSADLHLGELALEVSLGLLIGVLLPLGAILLERSRFFSASPAYEPLNGLAIGLLALAVGQATHANLFLAAFAAGITVATFGPRQRPAFEHFGENIAELFKLAALLVFGALISPAFLGEISWSGWIFAILAIFVASPFALWLSFLRSGLGMREQAATMWFGPKGFASVVYGLIVLESGITAADEIFHLVAVTIVLSILLHSSTDVVVARAFDEEADVPGWYGVVRRTVRAARRGGTSDVGASHGRDDDRGTER